MDINRLIDARRAVEEHPPWVLTPDYEVDGAAVRIAAAVARAIRDLAKFALAPDLTRRVVDRVADFVAAELRRVLFDRGRADERRAAQLIVQQRGWWRQLRSSLTGRD